MNMNHLEHMQAVADDDVQHLLEKEKTYQGSWKRRGGIGAFMMLARKWDRLEIMSKQRGYDIFRETGDGSDGTPLAEIRDLRRYLLLVEAELVALEVAHADDKAGLRKTEIDVKLYDDVVEQLKDELEVPKPKKQLGPHLEIKRTVPRYPDGMSMRPQHEVRDEQLRAVGLGDAAINGPGTPEDGGHHEQKLSSPKPVVFPERLDDGLRPCDVSSEQRKYYTELVTERGTLMLVNRDRTPAEMWDHLPRLNLEMNDKELQETPAEYKRLYTWHQNASKWVMRPECREHWGKQ
jgi:hypothetical protein